MKTNKKSENINIIIPLQTMQAYYSILKLKKAKVYTLTLSILDTFGFVKL